jgi:predicted metal-dependent hydrolase
MSTLFHPEDLKLRQTGMARLRVLARKPARPATIVEAREDEDAAMIGRLRLWGADLAGKFGLRYRALDPEHEDVVEHYGICYEDGVIRIRLRHARTGHLLKESSLVDTLCHELAHLRHLDHSIRWNRLYRRILDVARELEYYRPGPLSRYRPHQLSLFGKDCGTA